MAVKTVKVNMNGQDYALSYNSTSGKWEGSITAPSTTSWNQSNNKYGVTVTATDEAGNSTIKDRTDGVLGSALQLRVLEKDKPTITLSSPSSGARVITSKPAIKFTLRDSGSGIDISKLQLKIDSGTSVGNTATGMACTSVPGGYDCTYTPTTSLSEGSHTITISITDNDGNISDLLSSAFNVDTVPPALNISNPSNGLITNNKTLTVRGTTNDETSSPVTVSIKLNGVDQGAVTVSSGSFSKALTLAEGSNTIEIKAVDSAGLTSTVTRTVTLDTKAPTISAVAVTPNPVDCGKTFVITVTVND
ncbi:Ig-like domain-containing protein [Haloimpatiens massiliensis]|uniref:Ig-like domain-containing protein n=1 Tax=Haloimpatiens massiliensis TaxID=1658110 RepID=UPI000C837C46|nr:Ig-like domain-containing protein [Haloimpatiens massiliensis]